MNLFTRMWSPIWSVGSIDPEGILNACTTKVRMHEREQQRDAERLRVLAQLRTCASAPRRAAAAAVCGRVPRGSAMAAHHRRGPRSLATLEHGQERLLRDLDPPDLLHALLPFLLLLEELALAGDVAAVALGGDVLAQRLDASRARSPWRRWRPGSRPRTSGAGSARAAAGRGRARARRRCRGGR